jgi:Protein of unknown function DUF262
MDFTSSVQTIAWFRDQYRNGKLVIKPPFQRKPVWATRQKCYLIESILLKLPIPEICIQQTTTADGEVTYAVVDGQQRIRAVLQFVGSETDEAEQEFNKFVLDKLDSDSQWFGKYFADLSVQQKQNFYGYNFSVRYLNNSDDAETRDMFRRFNRFLSPLKPQELRNATFVGPFARLAEKLADDEYWAENRIITAASIRRMGDIEFVSELLIGVLHGPQAGSAVTIDEYYRQYEDYEDEFPDQKRVQRTFEENLAFLHKLLPDIKATRWSNKTDFYSLFVVLSFLPRPLSASAAAMKRVRGALDLLEQEVGTRLAEEQTKVSEYSIQYVRAVEKGANDKARRAARHVVLLKVLGG